jgi:hypothetical protein
LTGALGTRAFRLPFSVSTKCTLSHCPCQSSASLLGHKSNASEFVEQFATATDLEKREEAVTEEFQQAGWNGPYFGLLPVTGFASADGIAEADMVQVAARIGLVPHRPLSESASL